MTRAQPETGRSVRADSRPMAHPPAQADAVGELERLQAACQQPPADLVELAATCSRCALAEPQLPCPL